MAARPRVKLKCVADTYTDKSRERVVEFFDDKARKGGLIALRRLDDGSLLVQPYQLDHGVFVTGPGDHAKALEALRGMIEELDGPMMGHWTERMDTLVQMAREAIGTPATTEAR